MARQWRIEYPGAIYHVLSRGNGRQDIFYTDKDRHVFLGLLENMADRFDIQIAAYVLMGNHYHLLLKTIAPNLSKAMQWFGTTYTRRFHANNHTSGHLFQGRFKSILVENEAYLLRLSSYVHRNPLRAGIVKRLADYPWSSYRYYAYSKKPPDWLTTHLIKDQIHDPNQSVAYRKMVQHYSDEKGRIWEDVKHGLVLGSQNFVNTLKERFLDGAKDGELPQRNRMFLAIDTDALVARAARQFDLDINALRRQKRVSSQTRGQRDMLICFLYDTGRLSNEKIASVLGVSGSNISHRVRLFKAQLGRDRQLRLKYEGLKSLIKV